MPQLDAVPGTPPAFSCTELGEPSMPVPLGDRVEMRHSFFCDLRYASGLVTRSMKPYDAPAKSRVLNFIRALLMLVLVGSDMPVHERKGKRKVRGGPCVELTSTKAKSYGA